MDEDQDRDQAQCTAVTSDTAISMDCNGRTETVDTAGNLNSTCSEAGRLTFDACRRSPDTDSCGSGDLPATMTTFDGDPSNGGERDGVNLTPNSASSDISKGVSFQLVRATMGLGQPVSTTQCACTSMFLQATNGYCLHCIRFCICQYVLICNIYGIRCDCLVSKSSKL